MVEKNIPKGYMVFELDITLVTSSGFSLELFVPPKCTVADIRRKLLAARTFTDPACTFSYEGRHLNDTNTLESYGITEKATITFVEHIRDHSRNVYIARAKQGRNHIFESSLEGDLPITIKHTGEDIVLLVQPAILIGYLKIRLEQLTHIPYDLQKLSYPAGRMVLENSAELDEYAIGEDFVLELESLAQTGGRRRKTARRRNRNRKASKKARRNQ